VDGSGSYLLERWNEVPTSAENERICPPCSKLPVPVIPLNCKSFYGALNSPKLCPPCSKLPVPVILVNYDGFYGALMEFLRACDRNGTIGVPELRDVVIASENDEVCCKNRIACQHKLITSRQTLNSTYHMT
jgi:Possible lysine decarboxylase